MTCHMETGFKLNLTGTGVRPRAKAFITHNLRQIRAEAGAPTPVPFSAQLKQSDKIWRIDLQDDHESCHPVALRMTLKS